MQALVIQRRSEEPRPMVHEEPRMLMVTLTYLRLLGKL